jgi:hypothetical protein
VRKTDENFVEKKREMLGVLLMFSWCSPNCDMAFKIIVEFEIIIIDL